MQPDSLLVLSFTVLLLQALRVLVLGYLARREQEAHLRLWALGFLVQLVGQVGVLPALLGAPVPALQVVSLACVFIQSVLLMEGTWRLLGRRLDRRWWLGAAVGFVAVGALRAAGASFLTALGVGVAGLVAAYARMALALWSRRVELSGLGADARRADADGAALRGPPVPRRRGVVHSLGHRVRALQRPPAGDGAAGAALRRAPSSGCARPATRRWPTPSAWGPTRRRRTGASAR